MDKTLIIARCSTTELKQDVSRQSILMKKKYSKNYDIVKIWSYYQSGTKNDDTNNEILQYCIDNNIKHIVCSELSRISRKVVSCLTFITQCSENGINVIIDNYNLHSLNENGTINTMTQLILSVGANFSAMELESTKSRLDSGRRLYIERGGELGRKKNSKETKETFINKHKDIVKLLKKDNLSLRQMSAISGKSVNTIRKVKELV